MVKCYETEGRLWGMQQVNFAIQNGCKLSRATVHKFKHNDVGDLERVLQQVDRHHRAARCLSETLLQLLSIKQLRLQHCLWAMHRKHWSAVEHGSMGVGNYPSQHKAACMTHNDMIIRQTAHVRRACHCLQGPRGSAPSRAGLGREQCMCDSRMLSRAVLQS